MKIFFFLTLLASFLEIGHNSNTSNNELPFSLEKMTMVTKEVVKKYFTKCIYILQSTKRKDLTGENNLRRMLKLNSRQLFQVGIATIDDIETERIKCKLLFANLDFEDNMPIKLKSRILFIIPDPDDEIREYLQEEIELHDLSRAKWLIFLDTTETIEEFFETTYVPLDCELLAVQKSAEGEISVTEVYHTYHTHERNLKECFQKHLLATWNRNSTVNWVNSTFYERRSNVKGHYITAALLKQAPYVYCEGDCSYMSTGFIIDLWDLVRARMNFTTVYKEPYDDGWYGARDENGTWNGVIGMIVDDNAEVGLNVLNYDPIRLDDVDYFPPLWNLKTMLHIKQPGLDAFHGEKLLHPFSDMTWWTIVITILTITFLLWSISHVKNIDQDHHGYEMYSLYDSAFYVLGLFCKQSPAVIPKSRALRCVFFTAAISAMLLIVAYSDTIITHLTVCKLKLPFTDFKELLRDGTYRVAIRKGSADKNYFQKSKDPVFNEIYEKLIKPGIDKSPNTARSGLRQICKYKKYGFMTSNIIFQGLQRQVPCNVKGVPHAYYSNTVSMVLHKASPYKRIFNYHIQELRRNGILKRLMRQTWPPKLKEIYMESPPAVTMKMVSVIFMLLFFGGAISFVILMLECATCYILLRKYNSFKTIAKKTPQKHFDFII